MKKCGAEVRGLRRIVSDRIIKCFQITCLYGPKLSLKSTRQSKPRFSAGAFFHLVNLVLNAFAFVWNPKKTLLLLKFCYKIYNAVKICEGFRLFCR